MTSYRQNPNIEQMVAQMIAPQISALAEIAADGAQRAAPPDKVWITVQDERVRREHVKAHGQRVPDNLRFTLDSPEYDKQHYGVGDTQMGRAPLDEDNFTPGLTANCRCDTLITPGIETKITAHEARVIETVVRAEVTCEHPLCVNAEFGNSEDHGARYMAAGLREAANRLRR